MSTVKFLLPSTGVKPGSQQGFTLIELLISLVLGLLISAAVVQIYITNVRTSTVQKGASEVQDASVFGIQLLESHIRMANLGNDTVSITDETPLGGIVLGPSNLSATGYYFTHTAGDAKNPNRAIGWSGISNTEAPAGTELESDQLTLQFTNLTEDVIPDCEGADIKKGETVVERYFLRRATSDNDSKSPGNIKELVLACDAGRVAVTAAIKAASATAATATASATAAVSASPATARVTNSVGGVILPATDTRNFGQAGQEYIQGVDQFKVLLGVQDASNQLRYVTSREYKSLPSKPSIVSVKLSLIVHGTTPVVGSEARKGFTVFGTDTTLKPKANGETNEKNQVRTTYESTSLLRNARVMN